MTKKYKMQHPIPSENINFDTEIIFILELRDARRALSVSSIGSFDCDEMSLGEKVEQVALHSDWLKRNQQILTSLYEHCLMVGTGDAEIPGSLNCLMQK